jgi:hypothetical protein
MIRKWLRALIGWDDVGAALLAQRSHFTNLENLIEAQGNEIKALKLVRAHREQNRAQVMDWEQQMADFAANPENFKESN